MGLCNFVKLTPHVRLRTPQRTVGFFPATYTLSWSVRHRDNSLFFNICIQYRQYLLFHLRVFRHMWNSHEWSINVKIISHSTGKARNEVLHMGIFHITLLSRRSGLVHRMEGEYLPKKLLCAKSVERWKVGRPKSMRVDEIDGDARKLGVLLWRRRASDREEWGKLLLGNQGSS